MFVMIRNDFVTNRSYTHVMHDFVTNICTRHVQTLQRCIVALHEPAGPTTLPPIPGPDLVAALGPAACEEMRMRIQEEGGHRCLEPADSDVWWAVYLPAFVNDLRREHDAARLQAS